VGGGQARCSLPGEGSQAEPVLSVTVTMLRGGRRSSWSDEHSEASTSVNMTLPEIATAYARIDKMWRSATRQSKKIHLVQLAQLDTAAAADLDLQQPAVRDLVRGIRLLRGRIPAIDTVTIRYVPRPTTTLPLVGRSRVLGRPGRACRRSLAAAIRSAAAFCRSNAAPARPHVQIGGSLPRQLHRVPRADAFGDCLQFDGGESNTQRLERIFHNLADPRGRPPL